MDDMPIPIGTSHGAVAVHGTKLYLCGGFLGGTPGPHVANCFVYDNSIAPGTTGQWSNITSLPDGGRAGGGMVYDTPRNALYFSGGTQRFTAGSTHADDKNDTWMYSFDKPQDGWVPKARIPFFGNHMSHVTVTDGSGKERHFFLGGQKGEFEANGNVADNYEWDAVAEVWIQRAPMLFPRGHASSSTRAIGCGFIVAGGAINNGRSTKHTSDISYYNMNTNSWTSVGNLMQPVNTPVCVIGGGYLNCETGLPNSIISGRLQITVQQ